MAKEIELEDGSKETVYTKEEYEAIAKEADDAKKLAEERGTNFTNYNKKTEELETKVGTLETQLTEKITKERESTKLGTAVRFHGNNEELKTKIESNYALLSAMPETTPEEINARMQAAATLSGISVESRNPIYSPTYGEPPAPKQVNKDDDFLKSEKGIAAQKAMGFSEEEITPKQ